MKFYFSQFCCFLVYLYFLLRPNLNLSCPSLDPTLLIRESLPEEDLREISPLEVDLLSRSSATIVKNQGINPLHAPILRSDDSESVRDLDPRLTLSSHFSDNFDFYSIVLPKSVISEDFRDCNLSTMTIPENESDRKHFLFLNRIQSEIFDKGFSVPDSLHDLASIRFSREILGVPPMVLSVLQNGYKPIFSSSPPVKYFERNNLSARLNKPFVRTAVQKLLDAGHVVALDKQPAICLPLTVATR